MRQREGFVTIRAVIPRDESECRDRTRATTLNQWMTSLDVARIPAWVRSDDDRSMWTLADTFLTFGEDSENTLSVLCCDITGLRADSDVGPATTANECNSSQAGESRLSAVALVPPCHPEGALISVLWNMPRVTGFCKIYISFAKVFRHGSGFRRTIKLARLLLSF